MSRVAVYQCLDCSKVRRIVQPELGIEKQNGLRQYSDIHRCSDGVLAVNNIQIDTNLVVRAIEKQELEAQIQTSRLNIPLPKTNNVFHNNIVISHLKEKNDFRAIFKNEWTGSTFNVGNVRTNEEAIAEFSSIASGISVGYYECTTELDKSLTDWLKVLINLIELIPPKEAGYFMEALHFIFDMRHVPPCVYDIHIIQLILSADDAYLELSENTVDAIPKDEELSEEHYYIIDLILKHINEASSLLEISKIIPDDFVYTIFLIMILEKYDIIKINKPEMIDEINDNFIDILID